MEVKITVTGTKKALNVWTMATATVDGKEFKIQMVRFDEPSKFGIRKGRISKLWVARGTTCVCSYDRGWDKLPHFDEDQEACADIIHHFN